MSKYCDVWKAAWSAFLFSSFKEVVVVSVEAVRSVEGLMDDDELFGGGVTRHDFSVVEETQGD